MYVLFNNYKNYIIYLSNICKLFIKIISVNNVFIIYCGTCNINDAVICYFVKRQLIIVLSLENCDTICKIIKWNKKILQTIINKTNVNLCKKIVMSLISFYLYSDYIN